MVYKLSNWFNMFIKWRLFMGKARSVLLAVALSCLVAACGGGDPSLGPDVVYNETVTLSEGQQLSVTLPAGSYMAEVTSSNNGVVVSWVGGSCLTSAEIKAISASCSLPIQGQLLVLNPTLLGLGGSEIVTVKVTAD